MSGKLGSDTGEEELVDEVADYLSGKGYRVGCSDNRKRVVRRKAEKFHLKDGELFYLEEVII